MWPALARGRRPRPGLATLSRWGVLLIAACHLGLGTVSAGCLSAPAGLIGWWPGDGDATDVAGGYNGTLAGGATATAAGLAGQAFGFDGVASYVQILDAPALRPANLTVEAWVRFEALDSPSVGGSPAGQQYLVFKQNTRSSYFEGYALTKVRNAGKDLLNFGVSSAAGQVVQITSETLVQTGAWYHVAGVRGSNFLQLYVNGQLEGQTAAGFVQDYGLLPLCFGSSGQSYYDHKLAGRLDEVSLYNRALSGAEIAGLYAAGATGKCKALAITTQPASQNAPAGAQVSFSVAAGGSPPLSFQWQKGTVTLTNGADVSGAAGPVMTLANVQTNDAGNYRVVVTNSSGSLTSVVASLTVVTPPPLVSGGADAVVLVNSRSARYADFQQHLQPYLDNFGVPYAVQDIATNAIGTNLGYHSLIIVGHRQLDTNLLYLTSAAQSRITAAISNGTGLVNFDATLSAAGGVPQYQFIQDIFGFSYGAGSTGTVVTFPATEPASQMHYVTARHLPYESLPLASGMNLAGLTLRPAAAAVALCAGQPFVVVRKFGQGRAVQWASYDWMSSSVLGPLSGLDDLVWRGLAWAARKPFVMRGLPNFVTMRVDDVSGPLRWVHAACDMGFKPFLAVFMSNISSADTSDLRSLITNGNVTASIHAFNAGSELYFDHTHLTAWPDNVVSNNFYLGTQWLVSNGITSSKIMATHNSEIGLNAFAGLTNWGIEYFPIEIVPGQIEYYATPAAPWLMAGPYRLYEPPGLGESVYPLYYADFLSVPGHPEFNGRFFNCYTEIRNVNPATAGWFEGGDWAPNTDVSASIQHGTAQLKRALDSLVLATVFSHENYTGVVPDAAWRAILQGVTNNLAAYHPIYVTLDYANQYVRATRTSRLAAAAFDAASGQVTATFTGATDLDTSVFVFVGEDNAITNIFGPVPTFSGPVTQTIATLGGGGKPVAPPLLIQSVRLTNGIAAITWGSVAGRTYTLQRNNRLDDTNWTDATPAVAAAGLTLTATNSVGAATQQFYRVLLNP